MTMRERIENGKLFTDYCEGLPEDRVNCKKRMIAFNNSSPEDGAGRMAAMKPVEAFCPCRNVFIPIHICDIHTPFYLFCKS